MRLGQTITDIRKKRKMTQEEFAKIFHVTRQTVSNWEKEKNYPDLETLIYMSEEFQISLDVMLKEDKQMAQKLNREIKFSKQFKRRAIATLSCVVIALIIGAVVWGIVWNDAKNSLETKFKEGAEMNGFCFEEQLGYYKKKIDKNTYYTAPNQSMPDYFEFVLQFYATSVDYYSVEEGNYLHIRWSERDKEGQVMHEIYFLDEHTKQEYTLSKEQEEEFCAANSDIRAILKEGRKIYEDIYE